VTKETDWEQYLPLNMYAYHTTVHSSTQVSPFRLMFWWQHQFNSFPNHNAFDPLSYQKQLQVKLANLQDIVEANIRSASSKRRDMVLMHIHESFRLTTQFGYLSLIKQGKLSSK